jgi:hypothetical protein
MDQMHRLINQYILVLSFSKVYCNTKNIIRLNKRLFLEEIERLRNILERPEEIRFLARDNFEFVIFIFFFA